MHRLSLLLLLLPTACPTPPLSTVCNDDDDCAPLLCLQGVCVAEGEGDEGEGDAGEGEEGEGEGDEGEGEGDVGGLVVEPWFAAAPDWNDFVLDDGASDVFAIADVACVGGAACVHGGAVRRVVVPGADCGSDINDALDLFAWRCVSADSAGAVFGGQLRDGLTLRDLVDANGFRSNRVVAGDAASPFAVWWGNAVFADADVPSVIDDVGFTGAVVLLGGGGSDGYVVAVDGVSLVGVDAPVVVAADAPAIWQSDSDLGVRSVVVAVDSADRVNVVGDFAGVAGIFVERAAYVRLEDVSLRGSGVRVDRVARSTLRRLRLIGDDRAGDGLALLASRDIAVDDVAVHRFGGAGVSVADNSAATVVRDVVVDGCAVGVHVFAPTQNAATTVTLQGLLAAFNGKGIHLEQSASLSRCTATRNDEHGLLVAGAPGASTPTIVNANQVLVARNGTGVGVSGLQTTLRLAQLVSTANTIGVGAVNGAQLIAQGVFANARNNVNGAPTTTAPGTIDVFNPPIEAEVALVGGVDDTANAFASGAVAFPADVDAFDWGTFSHPLRVWGRSDFNGAPITGRWINGTGRVFDPRISPADARFFGKSGNVTTRNEPWVAGGPCPAQVYATVVVSDVVNHRQLANAVEDLFDRRGDDDGLCEDDEACTYTPHIGAWQGDGPREPAACVFDPPPEQRSDVIDGVAVFGLLEEP